MKKKYLKMLFSTCFVTCAAFVAYAQSSVVPANLKADVKGTKVELSWDRGAVGKTIHSNGFENVEFPGEGWTTKVTNGTDYKCSWFRYPTDEVKENLDGWEILVHGGEATAVVMSDTGWHEGESYIQDEWLISPVLSGAAYLDFYCYIHPMILEYGAYDEFPDHYCVKISQDGGENWDVLWDARYDSSPVDAWQQVSICLGETGENTKIAFEACGDQNVENDMSLYFTWAIDDVVISNSETASVAARAKMQAKPRVDVSGLKSFRKFTPQNGVKASRPANVKSKAGAAGYYNVYLDNEVLVTGLKSLCYVDETDKAAGSHVYKVTYVDPETGAESEGAEVSVTIDEMTFNPPTNLRLSYAYDEAKGSYSVTIAWDAPEGDRSPIYYSIYRDGKQIAWQYPEYEFTQTMMPRGVFTYQVSATYEYPSGDSEIVSDIIAIDTRYPVMNLASSIDGADVVLTWDAPKAEEGQTLVGYAVYRGNTCLASDVTETKYVDAGAPEGVFDYSVFAVYASGEKSPRKFVQVALGSPKVYTLPLNENFDGGMTPVDWTVVTGNNTDVNYRWRFDNFYELPINGEGFSGDFASINTISTGYNMLDCELRSPQFQATLKEGEKLYVEFDLSYLSEVDKNAELSYSNDGGLTWVQLCVLPSYTAADLAEGETFLSHEFVYDMSDCVTDAPMMLRWYYSTYTDGYLAIDNVSIYAKDDAGVNDIISDKYANAPVKYFNLQGVQVANPENGVFIRVQGNQASKVLVK